MHLMQAEAREYYDLDRLWTQTREEKAREHQQMVEEYESDFESSTNKQQARRYREYSPKDQKESINSKPSTDQKE